MGDLEAQVDAAWAKARAEQQQRSEQAQQTRDIETERAVEAVRAQFAREIDPAMIEGLAVRYQRMEEKGPFDIAVYFSRYGMEWRVVMGKPMQTSRTRPPAPGWTIQFRPQTPPHAKWQYHTGQTFGDPPVTAPGSLKDELLRLLGEVKNASGNG